MTFKNIGTNSRSCLRVFLWQIQANWGIFSLSPLWLSPVDAKEVVLYQNISILFKRMLHLWKENFESLESLRSPASNEVLVFDN